MTVNTTLKAKNWCLQKSVSDRYLRRKIVTLPRQIGVYSPSMIINPNRRKDQGVNCSGEKEKRNEEIIQLRTSEGVKKYSQCSPL